MNEPVKTYQVAKGTFNLSPTKTVERRIDYQKHTFHDNTSRLQIFGGETETEYLNVQETVFKDKDSSYF